MHACVSYASYCLVLYMHEGGERRHCCVHFEGGVYRPGNHMHTYIGQSEAFCLPWSGVVTRVHYWLVHALILHNIPRLHRPLPLPPTAERRFPILAMLSEDPIQVCRNGLEPKRHAWRAAMLTSIWSVLTPKQREEAQQTKQHLVILRKTRSFPIDRVSHNVRNSDSIHSSPCAIDSSPYSKRRDVYSDVRCPLERLA